MRDCSRDLSIKLPTKVPSLEELTEVISKYLTNCFADVKVDVVECPDLKKAPFLMTGSGIGGALRIAEIGGIGNLFPKPRKDKYFDLKNICATCEMPEAFVFGPGAGPWHIVGCCCEMVTDASFSPANTEVAIRIAKICEGKKGYEMGIIDKPYFSLMANLAVSNGQPGHKVLHIRTNKRTGETNFPESIRRAVAMHYPESLISMAGIFVLKKGKAKLHVMPDFPENQWDSLEQISRDWLRFFEMDAPIVCTTVIHSKDVDNHKLRLEHTHCYSEHGDAGHYHYDTTPDDVEYEGFFAPANCVYRIDTA